MNHSDDQQALGHWLQKRIPSWENLEELLKIRAQKHEQVDNAKQILTGFRSLITDLSLARQTLPDSRIHNWLEALFLKTHQIIFRPPGNTLLRIRDIYVYESPALIRSMSLVIISTIALFLISFICGWLLIYSFPDLATLFVSSGMINDVQAGKLWTDDLLNIMPSSLLSFSIMTNNITVSIFAFALGALYGLGTLYVITLNGLMLGGTFAFTAQYGLDQKLLQFVMAHGVVELSVICIAGAMGLRLGEALLRPGTLTRSSAFRKTTSDAGKVLIVAVPFLILTGFIEGYISPDDQYSMMTRTLIGTSTGIVFWLIMIFGFPWLKR